MKRSYRVILSPEGRVLRSLRMKRKLSMRKAGLLMGYSDGYISQIENGRENPPKGEKLLKFLAVYGIKEKHFKQLAKNWREENTDAEIIQTILPKLKPNHLKVIRTMVEQMAKAEI